jgi:hypothetical protein
VTGVHGLTAAFFPRAKRAGKTNDYLISVQHGRIYQKHDCFTRNSRTLKEAKSPLDF